MRKETKLTALSMLLALPAAAWIGSSFPVDGEKGRIRADVKDVQVSAEALALEHAKAAKPAGPTKIGPTGSSLYGYMSYMDEEDFIPGFFELDPKGSCTRLWDYPYAESWANLINGWIRNGRLCGLCSVALASEEQPLLYAYQEFDMITGEVFSSRVIDIEDDLTPYFNSAAYNPTDGRIYGYGMVGPSSDFVYAFKSAPADKPEETVVIKKLELPGDRCYSFCWSSSDNCFYGVNTWGKFVKLLPDGTTTELFDLPISDLANGKGALAVSPNDGYLLWNPAVYEAKSNLYAIYPSEKRMESLVQYPVDRQFTFFISADDVSDSSAPAAPAVSASYEGNRLTGSLSFTLPEVALNGETLEGSLEWLLFDNGKQIEEGAGVPGESVTLPAVAVEQGEHTFTVRAKSGNVLGYPGVITVYVGNDTPLAPANVKLSSDMISWDAVIAGVHGGYLDASEVVYKVFINEEEVGTTTMTWLAISQDEDAVQNAYRASVVAVAADLCSEPGYSEKMIIGRPFDLPLTIEPTWHDGELVTIIDNDEGPEYGRWRLTDAWGDLCFASGWSMKRADDWLILPAASFPTNEVLYKVSIDAARGGYTGSREYFEVWAGTEPTVEAMTIPVISKTRAQKFNEYVEYSGVFSVPRAGKYYIAVRGCSDPDQKDLIVRNIRVDATEIVAQVPAAVSDLEILSVDHSVPSAMLSFRLPEKYVNGESISGTVKATAYGAENVSVEGEPGSLQQVVVPTSQGENYIKVVAEVDGLEGQYAEVSTFTGMDMLGFVENFNGKISEDNMSVALTWTPPVESLNGGYFRPDGINYWIGPIATDGSFEGDPVLAGTDVTSYEYRLEKGAPQQFLRIGIAAENAAGISYARSFVGTVIGTPYSLPIKEDYENMEFKYSPITSSAPTSEYSDGAWTWCQPELVDPDYYNPDAAYGVIGYTEAAPSRVRMGLPKFSTVGAEDPVAIFNVWTGKGAAENISIYATTWGQAAPTLIGSIPAGTGWSNAVIPIPESYRNRPWMNLYIDGKLPTTENYLIRCGYTINPVSGVQNVNGSVGGSVVARKGMAVISGFEGMDYSINGIDGLLLAAGKMDSDQKEIVLPAGLCVVRVGERAFRILIP